MTRILIISTDVVGAAMAGPGIRALELGRALARAAHTVVLAVPSAGDFADAQLTIAPYTYGQPGAFAALLAATEVVVGQGFVFEAHPELLASDLPLAIDLYDPLILESLDLYAGADQATLELQAARYLRLTLAQLRRGDFFFCATAGQRDYWLGALTAAGRLTPALAASSDRELRALIDLVPSGIDNSPPQRGAPALRGVHPAIAADDLLLVWAGGLWDWFDPLTVVRAVADLRDTCPRLRLCFFAGARPNPHGAPVRTRKAEQVSALAAELAVLNHSVIMLDFWVPYEERGRYLAEADVGVSAHLPGIETRFAFRTRLLDYLWARLPLIGTAGDSLGELIAGRGAGLLVEPGDQAGWRAAISRLYHDVATREAQRAAADQLARAFTWDEIARPLATFCAAPRRTGRAPDDPGACAAEVAGANAGDAEAGAYAARLEAEIEAKNAHIARLEALIRRLENGRVMRILGALSGGRADRQRI